MRRSGAAIAVLAALVAGPAVAGAARPAPRSLRHLAPPQDYMANRPWGDRAFKAALAAVLAPKAPLARLYAGGPVMDANKSVDGTLLAWACRAHDCASVQTYVFVEAAKDRLFACWHDDERDPTHDWWLARGRPPQALESGACKQEAAAIAAYRAQGSGG